MTNKRQTSSTKPRPTSARIRGKDLLPLWSAAVDNWLRSMPDYEHWLAREDWVRSQKFEVWLGGPGKSCKDYVYRATIRDILRSHKFKVVFSEMHKWEQQELADKEIAEIHRANAVFIIAITPGAAAEAIEFANLAQINKDHQLKEKLNIFIPKDYNAGYIYKSLERRHRLIHSGSSFDLKALRKNDPLLALRIFQKAMNCANNEWRMKSVRERDQ